MSKGHTLWVIKNEDFLEGLPCDGCGFVIWPEETFTEETYPSQIKKAWCAMCKPQFKVGPTAGRVSHGEAG